MSLRKQPVGCLVILVNLMLSRRSKQIGKDSASLFFRVYRPLVKQVAYIWLVYSQKKTKAELKICIFPTRSLKISENRETTLCLFDVFLITDRCMITMIMLARAHSLPHAETDVLLRASWSRSQQASLVSPKQWTQLGTLRSHETATPTGSPVGAKCCGCCSF